MFALFISQGENRVVLVTDIVSLGCAMVRALVPRSAVLAVRLGSQLFESISF